MLNFIKVKFPITLKPIFVFFVVQVTTRFCEFKLVILILIRPKQSSKEISKLCYDEF